MARSRRASVRGILRMASMIGRDGVEVASNTAVASTDQPAVCGKKIREPGAGTWRFSSREHDVPTETRE
jgi:hypothetical protein